jgi:hypothetical protein
MIDLKKTITKATLGTVAAGAMALASATPAMADDHRQRDRGGVSAGDVIAGAVIIGGIAALAGAFDGDRDRRYDDRRFRDRHYNDPRFRGYDRGFERGNRYGYRGGHPDRAVQRCVNAVEREARRAGFRYANVTSIRDIDRERRGFEIEGRIEVADGYRGRRGIDRGRFSCDIRGGRITDIDFRNIRGLR